MKTDLSSLFMPRQPEMPKDDAVSNKRPWLTRSILFISKAGNYTKLMIFRDSYSKYKKIKLLSVKTMESFVGDLKRISISSPSNVWCFMHMIKFYKILVLSASTDGRME